MLLVFPSEIGFIKSSKKNYATKRGFGIGNFRIKLVDVLILISGLILLAVVFK